ncbi:hypothetical protein Mgra_00008725, partial [Meloidogyne graminicola]
IKYHFINQNIHENIVNYPEHSKLVYIGGINIEDSNMFLNSKNEFQSRDQILVSFGTVNSEGLISFGEFNQILNIFKYYTDYHFIYRSYYNTQNYYPNITITNRFIRQQK